MNYKMDLATGCRTVLIKENVFKWRKTRSNLYKSVYDLSKSKIIFPVCVGDVGVCGGAFARLCGCV